MSQTIPPHLMLAQPGHAHARQQCHGRRCVAFGRREAAPRARTSELAMDACAPPGNFDPGGIRGVGAYLSQAQPMSPGKSKQMQIKVTSNIAVIILVFSHDSIFRPDLRRGQDHRGCHRRTGPRRVSPFGKLI